jgi:hypothetical protein
MRTKTLLLGAAALAASVMTSMAQNVYSVNVVGYINITLAPGYNVIGNQLDVDGVDAIGTVLNNTMVPTEDGMEILTFTGTGFKYDFYDGYANVLPSPGWYDNNTGNASTNTIQPGTGFYILNPLSSNVTLTVTGSVLQGTNSIHLVPGYTLVSTLVPQAITLDTTATNNFPAVDGTEYLSWTNNGHGANFATADFWDQYGNVLPSGQYPGWYDNNTGNQVFPTPAVGQGYFISNPVAATNWVRFFQVQ